VDVRSDTYTFGHDIEASWLLCEAAGSPGRRSAAEKRVAEPRRCAWLKLALNEGVGSDGGLRYEGQGRKNN
jgi:mannobiose 2-epimerase